MPLTREPKYKDIYTDEVDQKGGYTAKVKDPKAREAARKAEEKAEADLNAYKETNDAAVAGLDDRLTTAESDIDDAEADIVAINKRGIYYGECSSAADAVAKTVTLENGTDFTLTKGVSVVIKFTYANTASSPTLAINNTAAKAIKKYGTTAVGTTNTTNGWPAGGVLLFVYDGTNWVEHYWYNTTYSLPALGCAYGTCETAAATAAKVVAISGYKLVTGGLVSIVFNEAVPASATLNINSQGAKGIRINNRAIKAGEILAYDRVLLVYSGAYYWVLAIDRASTWTLMWTNSSPSSNFAAQTVSLSNLSRYSEVLITYRQFKSSDKYFSCLYKMGDNGYAEVVGTYDNAGIMTWNRREVQVKTSGIVFSQGLKKDFNSSSSRETGQNDQLIPYKIYAR